MILKYMKNNKTNNKYQEQKLNFNKNNKNTSF